MSFWVPDRADKERYRYIWKRWIIPAARALFEHFPCDVAMLLAFLSAAGTAGVPNVVSGTIEARC